jgi:hypothetical protein
MTCQGCRPRTYTSQVQEDYRLRSTGMAITFAVIAVTALVLVAHAFSYLGGLA